METRSTLIYQLHYQLKAAMLKIFNGDLMLYGSTTVVLFYKNFNTIYSYTRLGKIDHPEDLQRAVWRGNVEVTFSLR